MSLTQRMTFHVEECCNCHVLFAMTEEMYQDLQAQSEERRFYCPNGHDQWYVGKSDRKLIEEAERRARDAETRLQAERDQRIAAERELRRQERRSKAGACPCCNRTFVQLSRHIKTKHPDFAAEAPA